MTRYFDIVTKFSFIASFDVFTSSLWCGRFSKFFLFFKLFHSFIKFLFPNFSLHDLWNLATWQVNHLAAVSLLTYSFLTVQEANSCDKTFWYNQLDHYRFDSHWLIKHPMIIDVSLILEFDKWSRDSSQIFFYCHLLFLIINLCYFSSIISSKFDTSPLGDFFLYIYWSTRY